ncbi:hypothetical protein [uncultured Flavobacterium sp.]|uniref:hypothetical protein n=1 Tax=uncultured Flavobacterium sp. TaxID=165435 RepID=UPI0025935E11|nr:hypothetical protein [uncultured Flavobacterium sp.]
MLTTSRIKEITHELAEKTCKILGVFKCSIEKKELSVYIKSATEEEIKSLYNKLVMEFKNSNKISSILFVTSEKTYFPLNFN